MYDANENMSILIMCISCMLQLYSPVSLLGKKCKRSICHMGGHRPLACIKSYSS